MSAPAPYLPPIEAPSREEVDRLVGTVLLEFGTDWCGHCRAAQAPIAQALAAAPALRHLRIEDGPGRALGRSFRVKLWPTLVLLRDGIELGRLVRPVDAGPVAELLALAG
jgi:thioredoxin 1